MASCHQLTDARDTLQRVCSQDAAAEADLCHGLQAFADAMKHASGCATCVRHQSEAWFGTQYVIGCAKAARTLRPPGDWPPAVARTLGLALREIKDVQAGLVGKALFRAASSGEVLPPVSVPASAPPLPPPPPPAVPPTAPDAHPRLAAFLAEHPPGSYVQLARYGRLEVVGLDDTGANLVFRTASNGEVWLGTRWLARHGHVPSAPPAPVTAHVPSAPPAPAAKSSGAPQTGAPTAAADAPQFPAHLLERFPMGSRVQWAHHRGRVEGLDATGQNLVLVGSHGRSYLGPRAAARLRIIDRGDGGSGGGSGAAAGAGAAVAPSAPSQRPPQPPQRSRASAAAATASTSARSEPPPPGVPMATVSTVLHPGVADFMRRAPIGTPVMAEPRVGLPPTACVVVGADSTGQNVVLSYKDRRDVLLCGPRALERVRVQLS